jgi:hypothetical protein
MILFALHFVINPGNFSFFGIGNRLIFGIFYLPYITCIKERKSESSAYSDFERLGKIGSTISEITAD